MFNREEWSQVLIPKATKEEIRQTAKSQDMKLWEVVDTSLREWNGPQRDGVEQL